MKYFNRKFVVLVFLTLILFSAVPKTTFAAVPTFETNAVLVGKQTLFQNITSVQSITTALQSTLSAIIEKAMNVQQLFEWAFKIAAEALRRQLLNMIVDQIVAWIQGGGTPKFITDWPGFFRDAIDAAGGQFIQELGLGLFCSPFNLQLRAAFIPIPRFSDRSACTISKIGVNLNNFLNNFNSGGWIAWNEMVLKPQNNIYGAYLMAWDEYEIRKSAAAKAAEAEAQAGRGFLSVRRCIAQRTVEQFDEDANPLAPKTICDKDEIVTPGSVVGELAGQALGSDIPYIISAQDFAAYTTAITNAILNRIFAEGVGLLRSATSGSSSGGSGSSSGSASNAQAQCASFLGTSGYTQCVNTVQSGQNISTFQKDNLIKTIDEDLPLQNQLLGAKQTTLAILNQSFDTLQQLKTCDNSQNQEITKVQADINTITNQIAGIQSDVIALQLRREEVINAVDATQISALNSQIARVVVPSATQSLALAAQQETSQRQTNLVTYEQQLKTCLQKNP